MELQDNQSVLVIEEQARNMVSLVLITGLNPENSWKIRAIGYLLCADAAFRKELALKMGHDFTVKSPPEELTYVTTMFTKPRSQGAIIITEYSGGEFSMALVDGQDESEGDRLWHALYYKFVEDANFRGNVLAMEKELWQRENVQPFDTSWIIEYVRKEYPEKKWLMSALAECTESSKRSHEYIYLRTNRVVNPVGEGIRYRGVILSDTVEGDLCIDVDRHNGSVKGIEYISRLD